MIEIITSGIFTKDMYCRPLEAEYIMGNELFQESNYSGRPMNNFKWVPITSYLGECWIGRTIKEYENNGPRVTKMEWVRGDIPEDHILKTGRK